MYFELDKSQNHFELVELWINSVWINHKHKMIRLR